MNDKQLIKKILEHNDQAFCILVEKYKKLVYAAIFRLVHDRNDAEDIFQDVFMEVYRSLYYLRSENDLSAWLFKISYNKTVSFLRKKNPARVKTDFDKEYTLQIVANNHSVVDNQTPARKLEDQETKYVLYAAIDRLPEMQKKVWLMHKFEDYSHKEISEKLELSIASVESLIYRANVTLRKSLYTYFKKN